MNLKSCNSWMSFVVVFLFEVATGSAGFAQGMDAHAASRAPLSESTAMLMFGISLMLIGGILHRRSKATHTRAVYRPSRQLSVRLNDR
jgi:hypothetical protein